MGPESQSPDWGSYDHPRFRYEGNPLSLFTGQSWMGKGGSPNLYVFVKATLGGRLVDDMGTPITPMTSVVLGKRCGANQCRLEEVEGLVSPGR